MFQDSCYHVFVLDADNWEAKTYTFDEASSYCQSQGGDLVSFSSKDEEDFVSYNVLPSNMYNEYWIGMKRKSDASGEDPKNDYEWIDGTNSDYQRLG